MLQDCYAERDRTIIIVTSFSERALNGSRVMVIMCQADKEQLPKREHHVIQVVGRVNADIVAMCPGVPPQPVHPPVLRVGLHPPGHHGDRHPVCCR